MNLKKNLFQKLYSLYILLGEDVILLRKNQDLILNYAYNQGFIETTIINIKYNTDWDNIIIFYQNKNLFFTKTILVVNFVIKKLNSILIKKINEMHALLNLDILTILKFNHLSLDIKKNKLHQFQYFNNIVVCFTPYNLNFINWLQYEIQEKNIKIDKKAFFLLCKYYEGNTFFIYKILDILLNTWPDTIITLQIIKKIIIDFFDFSVSHWINAIFEGHIQKAMYILNVFYVQQYNSLILIRSLQKDLLKLIYIKREKNININIFIEKNNILNHRKKYFIHAIKRIDYHSLLKAIKILVNIEISIKKNYNNSVWEELKKLTLILS